jgi:hypothetical protein
MTALAFLVVAIVGMFLAGLLGDWYDNRRAARIDLLAPWRDRAPGEGFDEVQR